MGLALLVGCAMDDASSTMNDGAPDAVVPFKVVLESDGGLAFEKSDGYALKSVQAFQDPGQTQGALSPSASDTGAGAVSLQIVFSITKDGDTFECEARKATVGASVEAGCRKTSGSGGGNAQRILKQACDERGGAFDTGDNKCYCSIGTSRFAYVREAVPPFAQRTCEEFAAARRLQETCADDGLKLERGTTDRAACVCSATQRFNLIDIFRTWQADGKRAELLDSKVVCTERAGAYVQRCESFGGRVGEAGGCLCGDEGGKGISMERIVLGNSGPQCDELKKMPATCRAAPGGRHTDVACIKGGRYYYYHSHKTEEALRRALGVRPPKDKEPTDPPPANPPEQPYTDPPATEPPAETKPVSGAPRSITVRLTAVEEAGGLHGLKVSGEVGGEAVTNVNYNTPSGTGTSRRLMLAVTYQGYRYRNGRSCAVTLGGEAASCAMSRAEKVD